MPKKRHHDYLKSSQPSSASAGVGKDKPQKSVNELLTQLRYTSLASSANSSASSAAHSPLPANTPTVPPVLRHILQIPETPAPPPRRPVRQRFDSNGRRLPAGPPPPRSWTAPSHRQIGSLVSSRSVPAGHDALRSISLPGLHHPAPMSLLGLVIARLAANWEFHRVYDQHYMYHIPSHLKPTLMRELGAYSDTGLALGDLKALVMHPSEGGPGQDSRGVSPHPVLDAEITALDLTGALGKSLTLRDVTGFLFPARAAAAEEELQDSWEASEEAPTSGLPRALMPNLTHISLALNPDRTQHASWRDLLTLAVRLGSVTHLSLAYWPEPCFLQGAKFATVSSPQGHRIPYGGTNYYSHSLDHDWSEALLVLKKLSQSLYTLEFLDLTGCASWFKALLLEDEHDYVDWVNNWGKITHLRLDIGWSLADGADESVRSAHREACGLAASVERHIVTARGGRGRFISVERQHVQS